MTESNPAIEDRHHTEQSSSSRASRGRATVFECFNLGGFEKILQSSPAVIIVHVLAVVVVVAAFFLFLLRKIALNHE